MGNPVDNRSLLQVDNQLLQQEDKREHPLERQDNQVLLVCQDKRECQDIQDVQDNQEYQDNQGNQEYPVCNQDNHYNLMVTRPQTTPSQLVPI